MTKRILTIILTLATSSAWAGSGTVNYNSTGSSPFQTTTNGSSNNLSQQTIWDYSAGANGAGVDSSHGLLVDPAVAASWNTSWAGGVLGAMANYGTSPGAVLVPGVNASVTSSALPTGAATKANQDTNSATTAHTCSTAGTSEIGCLGQIDDDVKGIGQVTIPGAQYNTIAASQTAQAMTGGSGGATGDFLSHCVLYPVTTSPGVVTVFDSTSSAANNVIAFAGGATSASNLTPISVPVQAYSINGAWKVTTGTNIIVTCYGKFH